MISQLNIWIVADIYPKSEDFKKEWHWGMQEWESQDSIDILTQTIKDLGYAVEFFRKPQDFFKSLAQMENSQRKNTIVWNLVEGYESRSREGYLPAICEYFGIACTGSDAYGQIFTLDKYETSKRASILGIPLPLQICIRKISDCKQEILPSAVPSFFVKPNQEGSSVGIEESAICHSFESTKKLAETLLINHQEILIQEYLPGKEYSVALLEICDKSWQIGSCEIITPRKVYDKATKSKDSMPESLAKITNSSLEKLIENLSLNLVNDLGLAGYARADWKCDSDGKPKFLEINCTPGLSKVYSLFPKILQITQNLSYENLIQKIIENARNSFHSLPRYNYGKSFT